MFNDNIKVFVLKRSTEYIFKWFYVVKGRSLSKKILISKWNILVICLSHFFIVRKTRQSCVKPEESLIKLLQYSQQWRIVRFENNLTISSFNCSFAISCNEIEANICIQNLT